MLTVDLRQRVLPANAQIFCVYAGRNRRYYREFKDHGIVFLETPDMTVAKPVLDNTVELRRHLRRSVAIEGDISANLPINLANYPLSNFDGIPRKEDRSANRLLGSFRLLFKNANSGDLIISPGSGSYRSILFGEITSPTSELDRRAIPRLGGRSVPFRRVKWIHEHPEEKALPAHLSKLLSLRPAVSKLVVNDETEEFYDIAYRNYVTPRGSRLNIHSPRYNVHNFFEVNSINSTLAILLATHAALRDGKSPATISKMSTDVLLSTYLRRDELIYVKQHFASPGNTDAKSKIREAAPVIGSVLAIFMMLGAAGAVNYSQAMQVQVTNSVDNSPKSHELCTDVAPVVDQMFQALGNKRCEELQRQVNDAASALKIEVGPKAKP